MPVPDDLRRDLKRRARALRGAAVMLPPCSRELDPASRNMVFEAYDEAAAILEDASTRVPMAREVA